MKTTIYKLIIGSGAILSGVVLVAFPEPFDMHSEIPHMVQDFLDQKNKEGSQDFYDHPYNFGNDSSSESRETSNDVDTGNSQDCR